LIYFFILINITNFQDSPLLHRIITILFYKIILPQIGAPVFGGKPLFERGSVFGGKPLSKRGSVFGGKPLSKRGYYRLFSIDLYFVV
jgi:hypothetical protein